MLKKYGKKMVLETFINYDKLNKRLIELFPEDKFPGAIGMNNKISNKLKLLYNRTTGYELPKTKTSAVKALEDMLIKNGQNKITEIYNKYGKKPILSNDDCKHQ